MTIDLAVKDTVAPFKEGELLIDEAGGASAKLCFHCKLCTVSCPWNAVRNFAVHKMMRQAQLGLPDFEDEDWWLCTTCGACIKRCPRGVGITDVMRSMRRIMVEANSTPGSLHSAAVSLGNYGNPLQEPRAQRAEWARDLGIKAFVPGTEVLYFPCCVVAYDHRVRKVAQATVKTLRKAGVDFGILGTEENCCGESARKAGNEALFLSLARRNVELFTQAGVRTIVVSSPHCYHSFSTEYRELGASFEVVHMSQYVAQLIKRGRLQFAGKLEKKVAYHDPCYLGRYSGIYDEPRIVLHSIPGLTLVELPDCRDNSMCCGGGGGRIWIETRKGERFSDLRIAQAVEQGADILGIACPYCMSNFEDSRLTSELSQAVEVRDITELVAEVL